jgi:hypothetical protein
LQELQEFRVQEYRSTGVQEFRSSGVQEFRSSGVQEYRSIGSIGHWRVFSRNARDHSFDNSVS